MAVYLHPTECRIQVGYLRHKLCLLGAQLPRRGCSAVVQWRHLPQWYSTQAAPLSLSIVQRLSSSKMGGLTGPEALHPACWRQPPTFDCSVFSGLCKFPTYQCYLYDGRSPDGSKQSVSQHVQHKPGMISDQHYKTSKCNRQASSPLLSIKHGAE